ncbi:hypothetical protein [Psychromonas sp. Urea-02u-13]|uniref:hypothetical protein n=1 Tax=Psychromonas sp. Urea-02u-13 TaxID=2058326 RepID=UPI001E352C99|nr:hypothetical protein [Psychromonas sp. Urea-02u-13]
MLLLSDCMVKGYVEDQQLVVVLPSWKVSYARHSRLQIFAIYKSSQYPKPHIRVFIDFLVEKLIIK